MNGQAMTKLNNVNELSLIKNTPGNNAGKKCPKITKRKTNGSFTRLLYIRLMSCSYHGSDLSFKISSISQAKHIYFRCSFAGKMRLIYPNATAT